jgi:hypothetical protein
MSLWLINAIAISLIGIPQLAIVGNELNGDPTAGFRPDSWNTMLIPTYVGIGLYALVTLALIVHAFGGCCNASGGSESNSTALSNDDDDNDNDVKDISRRRDVGVTASPGFVDFGNVQARVATPASQFTTKERLVRLVDCGIRIIFIGLFLAATIVLASTLETPPHARDWTAFFALIFTIISLYLILLIFGAIQTYIIDQSPAGKASNTATLFGGVLCCFSNSGAELAEEADESMEDNSHSTVARGQRYRTRAEFQDRPCVYICTPYAVPSWTWYVLAFLAWTIPIALLWSSVELYLFLNDHRPDPPATESEGIELTRSFNGRFHHIATFAPRVNVAPTQSLTPMEMLAARHNHGVDLLVVVLPLIVAIGILILQLPCLLLSCCRKGSLAIDWLFGFIYASWLGFWLWFLIDIIDIRPRENFQDLFTPLYILFGITIVFGIIGYLCMPKSYKLRREYVSEWGLMVYKD